MRNFCVFASAAILLGSSVSWAEPLAPGKPAGVHQAQMGTTEVLVFGGLALMGAGILIATSGGGSSAPVQQSVTVSVPATTS